MTTPCKAYRQLRRDDPHRPAHVALSIARGAGAAVRAGLPYEEEVTIHGWPYWVKLHPDECPAYDDDVHGQVVERWQEGQVHGSPGLYEGEWDGWSHDRADGDTVLALDDQRAYVVDRAAGSVSAMSDYYRRSFGMARGPARERARADLVREGRAMARDLAGYYGPPVYVVEVLDHTGGSATLGGVALPDDGHRHLVSLAHLWDVVGELAAELRADQDETAEALRRRFGHLPGLPVVDLPRKSATVAELAA